MTGLKRRDQHGVSMVELMVAMVLLAIALLGLAASVPYAMYGVVASGFQTTATLLAQEAIERAKAADYSSIASLSFDGSSGTLPTDCTGSGNLRTVSAYAGFSRCVAVQPGSPDGGDHDDHRRRGVQQHGPEPELADDGRDHPSELTGN